MNAPPNDRAVAPGEMTPRTRLLAHALAASLVFLVASCGDSSEPPRERTGGDWYARAGGEDPTLFNLSVTAGPPPELGFYGVLIERLDLDELVLEVEGADGQDPIGVPLVVEDMEDGAPPLIVVTGHLGESDLPPELGLANLVEALLSHRVSIALTGGDGFRRRWDFRTCNSCLPPTWP